VAGGKNSIEVSGVARINPDGLIVFIVDVEAAGLIEETQAKRGLFFAPGGEQQEQFSDFELWITGAEIGEPDETEGKDRGGVVLLGRRGNGSKTLVAAAEEGAGEHGGKAVFQIRFGGDFGDCPIRIFASKETAEAFAKFQFAAAFAPFSGARAGEIEQEEFAFASAEKLDGKFKFAAFGLGSANDPPGKIAVLFPRLQEYVRGTRLKRMVGGRKRQEGLAGFEERGQFGGGEELLHLFEYRSGHGTANVAGCAW